MSEVPLHAPRVLCCLNYFILYHVMHVILGLVICVILYCVKYVMLCYVRNVMLCYVIHFTTAMRLLLWRGRR